MMENVMYEDDVDVVEVLEL